MIEGEEIFESAQETGYRLCRSRENPTSEQVDLVFSANWDLNVPNRLHVCLQNGQLKVFNVESRTSERYNILFRRYTPVFEGNTQTEKLVSHHWDKMTTIPDRPDEIIFLMGISRTLMYTALPPPEDRPYPEMPLLASTARGDFPGFIFGSPVMEISSHHTRITSIAISPAGHILASGDESGNVRLLLLRLLDEISVFKQNERRRKKHTAATTFSQFLPTYNVTVPVHEGPVFSMQWLPILSSSQSNNVRNYALVTGSMDRSVRIWRVSCCSSKGISMTPAMVLDTLSTHVLSLNALFYTDRFALAKINRTEAFANRATRSLSRASSFSSMLSFGAGDFEFELPPAPNTSAANSIFLAAGTSVGTIYVWKLNFTDVQDAISPPPATDDKAGTGSADRRAVVSDDGTKLYSLLQTSDRPIIHVTLAAYPSASLPLSPGPSPGKEMTSGSGSGGDVVLAASDTQGAVHLYTPEKIVAHDGVGNPTKRQSRDLVELAHHPLYDEYRRKMSPLDAATQSLTPLVRVGEQSYPSAVVCCSFPPAYPNDDLAASPLSSPLNSPSSKSQAGMSGKTRLGKWDPAAMVQRNGPLLVGVAHGELYIYDSADLASLSTGQNKQLDKPLELEIVLEGGRRKSVSGAHVSDDHSDASEDSAVEASDRKTITRKNSMRERQQANATLAAAANAGGSDSDVCSQDEWENLKIAPKHVRYTAPVNATEVLPTKPAGSSFFADKKKAASAVVVEEDCSEYPRTKPPPAPVAAHVGPKSVNAGTKKPTPLNTSANKPAGNTGSRSVPVQEQHGASDDYDRTDLSVTTTASTPSSPLSTLPSPPKFVQNRIAAKAQQAPRVNSLATPVETFSKVLEGQVRNLATKLDNDEISVSTQLTTKSDKLAAASAAQAAVSRTRRYNGLTPMQYLDGADLDMLLAETRPDHMRPNKGHKQVDPEWLSHRKFGGPSAEDMSALDLQDPLVSLRLSCNLAPVQPLNRAAGPAALSSSIRTDAFSTRTGGRSRALPQQYQYNSEFGLRMTTDPHTLQQRFRSDVNMDQVFGRFDAMQADGLIRRSSEQFSRESILSLSSGSSVC